MLSRKVLLSCAILIFVFACRHESSYAADEQDWFGGHLISSHLFRMVTDIDIEKDLSITPQQRTTFSDLQRQYRKKFGELMTPPPDLATKSDAERQAISEKNQSDFAAVENEYRPQIWNSLNATQRERLYQIVWQLNVARAIAEESKVTSRIELEPGQKVAIDEIIAQYKKEVRKTPQERKQRPNQDERNKRIERDEAAEMKRDDQVLAVLTDRQRSEWSTLIGKPLDVVALRPRFNLSRPGQLKTNAMPPEGLQDASTSSPK